MTDRITQSRHLISTTDERSFRVEFKRDFHPGSALHWRLYTYGEGHWCAGEGHSGTFQTEAEADARGRLWVVTGLPPVRQPSTLEEVQGALAEGERQQSRRAA